MKPAVCLLCGKAAVDEIGVNRGNWVQFAEYVEARTHSLDHPKGLEYFCDEHLASAHALASKSSREALAELRQKLGTTFAPHPTKPRQPRSWRRRLTGGEK